MKKTLTKLQLAQRRKVIAQQTVKYYQSQPKAEKKEDYEWSRPGFSAN